MKTNNQTKKMINAINNFLVDNELQWVCLSHWQGTNPEQTNSCSWQIRENDYILSQNEYNFSPNLKRLSPGQICLLWDNICGGDLCLGVILIQSDTDTFGKMAGIENISVNQLFNK